jgi:hypothetical protein
MAAAVRVAETATCVLLRAAETVATTAHPDDRFRSSFSNFKNELLPGALQVLKKFLKGIPFFRTVQLIEQVLEHRVVREGHSLQRERARRRNWRKSDLK